MASNTTGPWFEFSRLYRKDENEEKRGWEMPIFKYLLNKEQWLWRGCLYASLRDLQFESLYRYLSWKFIKSIFFKKDQYKL